MKGKIWNIVGILAAIVLVIAICAAGYLVYDYIHVKTQSESFEKEVFTTETKDSESLDLDKLEESVPDAVGWIKIKGIDLSYPIVQTSDNDYYLTHDFEKNYSRHGAIFLDYRNKKLYEKNAVIYGHNMADGTMFHKLLKFKSDNFVQLNPVVYIWDKNGKHRYRIWSVRTTAEYYPDYLTEFENKETYDKWFNDISAGSLCNPTWEKTTNKMITLSTCADSSGTTKVVIHCVEE